MNITLTNLKERKIKLGSIGAIDFLISKEEEKNLIFPQVSYEPFSCKEVAIPKNIDDYKKIPKVLPKDFKLPVLQGLGNDYSFLLQELNYSVEPCISIVILNYNRVIPLRKTLTGILNQNYPIKKIEVIVTDDGSNEDTLGVIREFSNFFNIKYFWHPDIGFTPSIARNNGIAIASNDFVILLDVDMYPGVDLIKNYVIYSKLIDRAVLIGPRKYVDLWSVSIESIKTNSYLVENLKEVKTNNDVANVVKNDISVDWRLDGIYKSNELRNEKLPFRFFAAGNVAFSKKRFNKIGGFDERFRAWGYEDGELAFRFFNDGMYMIPVMNAWAYHQEPEGGENETNRSGGKSITASHYANVCPYYRHLDDKKDIYETPKVSIYIPAFNAEKTIIDAVESALNQTYRDIEICICDDGSTDLTIHLLEKYYINNKKVRWISQENKGIGSASNAAIKMCRGLYIGQLDSDDILATDVVERCIPYFEKDMKIGLVYTTYENENESNDGSIKPGYNYPIYNREKLATAMIAHHFRMFRRRDWARVGGFSEKLKNAVDFDFYLKLSERCDAHHINVIGYRRRFHGANTSLVNNIEQNKNARIAVSNSLLRQGVSVICKLEDEKSSKLTFAT